MMSFRRILIVVLICLAVVMGMALWFLFAKGTPRNTQGQDARPGDLSAAATVGTAGPTAAAPTPPPPVATPSPVTPPPSPIPSAERPVAPSVARFADTSLPLEKRMAEIEQLGLRGDAEAVQTLMKLGDTYTYLNVKAIEALGNVRTPEVTRYLEGKTGDKDPKIVAGAMRSLAQAQGAEAIPAIATTIAANRQRADGYQDTVCAAGVKALGEIGSPLAIPALAAEFDKTVGVSLQHEYGSQVVAAFRAIGDPAGAPTLEAYARRLQTQKDGMDNNPMGQRYLEEKIKEVREAITFITRKT